MPSHDSEQMENSTETTAGAVEMEAEEGDGGVGRRKKKIPEKFSGFSIFQFSGFIRKDGRKVPKQFRTNFCHFFSLPNLFPVVQSLFAS